MTIGEQIVIELSKKRYKDYRDFYTAMRGLFSEHEASPLPKATLILLYRQLLKDKQIKRNEQVEKFLVKNAIRTLSGVTVITVLTKPWECPGKCVFCPLEPGMPKSYLSNEPAAQRAVRFHFDPFNQVQGRIEALEKNGHKVDKLEIIVLGGTWSSYEKKYQDWFITQCFFAANTYGQKKKKVKSLESEQTINEKAKYRIIGLTLETRSDHVTEKEIIHLRKLGCTRVQLGIQHTDNKILKLIRRGEYLEDDIKATALLKKAGFKIDHHYMPDLPGATPAKDIAMMKHVYTKEDLQPDQVKIYPCIVNEYAQLYHWYKSGKYKPYGEKELIRVLLEIKKITPPYVRINRLIRDIPEESIIAGNDVTNLRQYLQKELERKNAPCVCIRCREARTRVSDAKKAKLFVRTYRASKGTEHFISYESPDKKILYAFLRLRFNDDPKRHFIPALRGAAHVRELHVYGQMVPVYGSEKNRAQHLGFGKKLMQEAERRTKENNLNKLAVISGIGVRGYYRKLGYRLKDTYMIKSL